MSQVLRPLRNPAAVCRPIYLQVLKAGKIRNAAWPTHIKHPLHDR